MKKGIRVLARFIGFLFVLCGVVFFGAAILTEHWFMYGIISVCVTTLGLMLLKAENGYLSDRAEKNCVDKLRESTIENSWDDS